MKVEEGKQQPSPIEMKKNEEKKVIDLDIMEVLKAPEEQEKIMNDLVEKKVEIIDTYGDEERKDDGGKGGETERVYTEHETSKDIENLD